MPRRDDLDERSKMSFLLDCLALRVHDVPR